MIIFFLNKLKERGRMEEGKRIMRLLQGHLVVVRDEKSLSFCEILKLLFYKQPSCPKMYVLNIEEN